jgi:hypothetical protein
MKEQKKEALVAVRLTEDEVERLDTHCQGQLSRAMILRILVQDFIARPEKEQREFLVKRVFGK